MTQKEFSEEEVSKIAKKAYESGQADFPILKEKTILLVIDMQDEFVKPHWSPWWVPEATRQVPLIKKLINFCRERKIPVIYTVYSKTNKYLDRPKGGRHMPNRYASVDMKREDYFIEGKVWGELAPQEEEIFNHKCSYGVFYDTPLETILKQLEKDTVVVCGTLTNYFCGSTVRQAFERGFYAIVGSDVCSTDDPSMQEPELKTLRKGFAKILTCEEIIKNLS
jgi:nicotinamidase-related amidase